MIKLWKFTQREKLWFETKDQHNDGSNPYFADSSTPGYFLTPAELEQFARDVWDSARASEYEEGSRVLGADIDFSDYWAEKKKEIETEE